MISKLQQVGGNILYSCLSYNIHWSSPSNSISSIRHKNLHLQLYFPWKTPPMIYYCWVH